MRNILALITAVVLLTGAALTGPAVARDRSDRPELTPNQITDQAAARAAKLKADLRLTPDQEKNWSAAEAVIVDVWQDETKRRLAWRAAHGKQQEDVDFIDEMRKSADAQIDRANARKKLADASQPLYGSLDDRQKRRFAEALFRVE